MQNCKFILFLLFLISSTLHANFSWKQNIGNQLTKKFINQYVNFTTSNNGISNYIKSELNLKTQYANIIKIRYLFFNCFSNKTISDTTYYINDKEFTLKENIVIANSQKLYMASGKERK